MGSGENKLIFMVKRRAKVHDVMVHVQGVFMFFRLSELIESDLIDTHWNGCHLRSHGGRITVSDGRGQIGTEVVAILPTCCRAHRGRLTMNEVGPDIFGHLGGTGGSLNDGGGDGRA